MGHRNEVDPNLTLWMGKASTRGLLTPKPVRLYYDHVFGNYWASKGPGDHTESYDGPGVTRGPFGQWTSLVSEDKAEVTKWLGIQKAIWEEGLRRALETIEAAGWKYVPSGAEARPAPRRGARQSRRRPSRG